MRRGITCALLAAAAGVENAFDLPPRVGDVLRISIFRNRAAGQDEFAATNTRTGRTQKITVRVPGVIYRHAVLGATLVALSGEWSPPATNTRLWVFRNIAITSYNSTHGTICGPWPAVRHLAAPVISVRMFPSIPSNSCLNFGAWLKGAT